MFSVGVIIPQYWRQDPSEHSNQNPVTFKFQGWYSQPCVSQILFPSIFSGIRSQPWVVSLLILADQDSGEYSMGFCSSPDSFSVRLCPLHPVLSPMNHSCCSLPNSQLCLLDSESAGLHLGSFCLVPAARNYLQAVSWAIIGSAHLFPVSQGSMFFTD